MILELLHKLKTSSNYQSVEEVNNDIEETIKQSKFLLKKIQQLKHEISERDNHIMRLVVENRELKSNG